MKTIRSLARRAPAFVLLLTTATWFGCAPDDGAEDETEPSAAAESPLAAPVTVSLQNGVAPTASYAGTTDATLQESVPAANAGAEPVIRVDMDYPNGSGRNADALLRFDVSAIPPGSVVQSVKLTLNVTNSTGGEGYALYALSRGWSEAQATWNSAASTTAWQAGGARGASDRSPAPLGTVLPGAPGKFTVTLNAAGVAAVQGWVDKTAPNHGMVLDASTNADGLEFDSSEAATATNRPALSVVYAPPAQAGTGLRGQYHSGIDFRTLLVTRTDPTLDFAWGAAAPAAGVPADGFSVRWTGQIVPRYSQTYTFFTRSDDGVRLWVNGRSIIDDWTDHGVVERSGSIALTAGTRYDIKVEYYDRAGSANLQLSWSSPSQARQIIPASQLFPSTTTVPTGFVHPGIVVNRGQLDFVKGRIAANAEPWKSQLNRALASKYGKTTWVARPVARMLCGNGPSSMDQGCTTSRDDALAAHTLALLWYHTGNKAYATAAIAILDAWSSTLTEIPFVSGNYDTYNGPLQAAWLAESFPRSAEILRHTASGWSPTNAARFGQMLKNVLVPRITSGWRSGGNWSTSMANGMINIGVYNDDRALFDAGLAAWRVRTPVTYHLQSDGPVPLVPADFANADGSWRAGKLEEQWWGQGEFGTDRVSGITRETCRDAAHTQMSLASITYSAETALHQGVNLYNEQRARIVATHEFVARWHNLMPTAPNVGGSRQYPTPSWLCPKQGLLILQEVPTWEVTYNHYARRLGIAMPQTQALITRYRASTARLPYTNLQMAWETLTHGDIGGAGLP